jgi:AsmA protein
VSYFAAFVPVAADKFRLPGTGVVLSVRWRAKKHFRHAAPWRQMLCSGFTRLLKEMVVKTLLKVLVVLLLLIVLAVAALFFWLDPNIFKPRIKSLAAEQGVALEIAGDISWQFWPSIGIEVEDITVASLSAPDDQLAHLRSASLLVATRPLFDKQLQVEHLIIDGASLAFELDESGASNWSRLADEAKRKAERAGVADPAQVPADAMASADKAKKDATPPVSNESQEDAGSSGGELQLAVEAISISDAQVSYSDAALSRTAEFRVNALKLTGFNTENQPFALSSDWLVSVKDPAMFAERELQVAGELSADVQIASDLSKVSINSGDVTLDISGLDDEASVSTGFELEIENPTGELMFNGHVALAPVNVKTLLASLGQSVPVTAEDDALTHLSINTNVSGSARSMTLAPLTLELDDTTVSGEMAVTDLERMALEVTLAGDRINVDHYLPPPVAEKPPTNTTGNTPPKTDKTPDKPSVASGDEPLIPLDAVRALNARVRIDLREAIVSGLTMQNLRLRLNAADGLVQLTEASLDAYEGQLQASGKLDGRGSAARLSTKFEMQGLNVTPLLSDLELDEKIQLSGLMNLDATASSVGLTKNELTQAAIADANFNGAQVTVAPINVEKYFCQAISLTKSLREKDQAPAEGEATDGKGAKQEPRAEQDWPELTEMHDLQGQIQLRQQVITIKSFTAGVEQLLMGLNGQIDLAGQTFDLRLPLTLEQPSTSAEGCTVNSNYWVNRSLSLLRCRGSITTLAPAKDCRLDSKALESLLGDYTKQRLKDELVRKLGGDEKNAEGDEETDPTKAAVKGLLNQFLNKDKKDKE